MELQDQSGHAIEIPAVDEEALKQGMLFLRRARSALHAASTSVAPATTELPPGPPVASTSSVASDTEHVAPCVAALTAPAGSAASPETPPGRREQLLLALALCQEGSAAFDRVDPRYVECMVDNAAMCWVQVRWAGTPSVRSMCIHGVSTAWLSQTAWLYFRLNFSSELSSAATLLQVRALVTVCPDFAVDRGRWALCPLRTQRARAALAAVHGPNLERLRALRGDGAVERTVYVRLDLLEGVVAQVGGWRVYASLVARVVHDRVRPSCRWQITGRHGDALRLLQRARQACDVLRPSPSCIDALALYGIPRTAALQALRATAQGAAPVRASASSAAAGTVDDATQGHIGRAAEWHFAEAERQTAVDEKRRELARSAQRAQRYGPTAAGGNVNVCRSALARDFSAYATSTSSPAAGSACGRLAWHRSVAGRGLGRGAGCRSSPAGEAGVIA